VNIDDVLRRDCWFKWKYKPTFLIEGSKKEEEKEVKTTCW